MYGWSSKIEETLEYSNSTCVYWRPHATYKKIPLPLNPYTERMGGFARWAPRCSWSISQPTQGPRTISRKGRGRGIGGLRTDVWLPWLWALPRHWLQSARGIEGLSRVVRSGLRRGWRGQGAKGHQETPEGNLDGVPRHWTSEQSTDASKGLGNANISRQNSFLLQDWNNNLRHDLTFLKSMPPHWNWYWFVPFAEALKLSTRRRILGDV